MIYIILIALSSLNALIMGFSINVPIYIRDIFIIVSPIIIFSHQLRFSNHHVTILLVTWFISFLVWFGFSGEFRIGFDILLGRSEGAELHQAAFLGFFFFFFLMRRKYIFWILTILLIFLAGKRVVFLGIVPALISYFFLFKVIKVSYNGTFAKIFLILYAISFFLSALYLVELTTLFLELVGMEDYKLSGFLQGRNDVVSTLRPEILSSGLNNSLFGHGPGQADIFLSINRSLMWSKVGLPANPHNDFLKIAFEYGLVGVFGFYIILKNLFVTGRIGYTLLLYAIPVFLVDNSLIFIWHFITGLIMAHQQDLKT